MAENSVNALPMEDFSATTNGIENGEIADPPGGKPSLDMLLNVPMRISVELGRARIPVKSILQLSQGSVVELDRASGEPLTIYINGELFAYGEAVLVNQERFGVRLTSIVNRSEQIKNPREP